MSTSTTNLTGRNARIAVAATWAQSFVHEAENCLKGFAHQLPRAAAQTVASIEAIDGPVEGVSTSPARPCRCGHDHFEDTCCCADPASSHGIVKCPTCQGTG